ncbi:hypothetical protein OS493_026768 [Desmophyllum pertusum]|uniref:SEA domain-containing protein n=1 Tax=Desmophyllum pertusum TaxID=174260 RepID=A0A9W9ZME1_9CNID|nr:hypothetical protein OS493_026768 [Desmophyllum pertusum]
MRGDKVFVCCALFLSTYIAFSSCAVTTPAPSTPKPSTPTQPGTPTKPPPTPFDPNTLQCTVYNLTLKLTNATYDDNLASPHSEQFIKLRTDFEVGVMQVYDGYKPFIGVTTLRFSKAADGKSIVHFVVEFKDNGTHLPNLTKALVGGILGKLTPVPVAPKLGQAACFKAPAPAVCPVPCSSACAPSCYDNCCQQGYPQAYYPAPAPPLPATCPNSCPNTCAPVGCTPACCNTVYNQAPYNYGKRHHAPKPEKGSKKHHIFRKHHRKN